MTKGRDNATDNLGDVLELIRVRRQSGLLSVERIQNGRFEEGDIYFQTGQPIYARFGSLTGTNALAKLLSWRQAYFAFATNQPRPQVNITDPLPARGGFATTTTDPLSMSIRPSSSAPSPDTNPLLNVRGQSAERNTNPQPAFTPGTSTPGLEWLVPQKRGNDRDVLSLPLTRPQRSIYLLVDGKRTVADLSRCTRKTMQEIERLLSELQERGLIVI